MHFRNITQKLDQILRERTRITDNESTQKAEIVNEDNQKKYTIDQILDSVEEGNVSLLVELGISYTEIATESGNKKISFSYEGTRYTVNIIGKSQEAGNVGINNTNNIQTVQNEEGGHTVYELSPEGSLLKSTEYDKEGRITHEFKQLEDGNRSDKYYTYENGELVQIQETIHYTDGNYTYIFTDDKGNLIEEQKVIHNELGGLTFDSTFGDGTRRVYIYNSDERLVNNLFYSADGNLEKTQECIYDADNPNFYTLITKNAEGKTLSTEYWENYSFVDEEGRTWYGSRLNQRFEGGSKYEEERKDAVSEYQKQLDYIMLQIRSLTVPTPPNANDYKTSNGTIDETAYNKAIKRYNEQKIKYYEQLNELNKKSLELNTKLHQAENQILKSEFKQEIAGVNDSITELKGFVGADNDSISILELALTNVKDALLNLPDRKSELYEKLRNIYLQITSLELPTPPSTSNFLKSDGSVDEEAYEEAFNKYEKEKEEYNKKVRQLEVEAFDINNEIAIIDMKIQRFSKKLVQLKKNINAVSTIQNLINVAENSVKDSAIIDRLKNLLEKLYKNIIVQNKIQQYVDGLNEAILNNSVPTPPSTDDYKNSDGSINDEKYTNAFKNYENAKTEYNNKNQKLNNLLVQGVYALNNFTDKVSEMVLEAEELLRV